MDILRVDIWFEYGVRHSKGSGTFLYLYDIKITSAIRTTVTTLCMFSHEAWEHGSLYLLL